ncbi:FAD-dependent oxidoreductase [Cuneatibacter sp. NSJ-177]|uniref:FAD-dependent oxidoreductase n=1 Tax=Cuneatibacter sp. NSJ-177 TaxID=2931401 RepID=UPI001FD3A743|nr:FAD-dependent oxidoreductase [Cuneatibacter sp. NSJ-177]MCJ7836700.1 FAD-dependent oxidoreductase [Cuneatibacter sp. NSJ-177]
MRVLIIGGVAAGAKTAAKLKREDWDLDVMILTKADEVSYAACGLPYYVGGVVEEEEQLIVHTPQQFEALTGVKVLTKTEITKVDRVEKTVEALNLYTGRTMVYDYDKLVIASGADSKRLQIPGSHKNGVHFLHTPRDAELLRRDLADGVCRQAVVAGGGPIGMEVTENLIGRGIRVTMLDLAPQVMPGYDWEIAGYVEEHLEGLGVHIETSAALLEILGGERVEAVRTDRRTIPAGLVVIAAGIQPNTEFLKGSGIMLMPNGTVKVNSQLKTNDPDVYALGDCACVFHALSREAAWSPMGSSANIEGRVLAQILNNRDVAFQGVVGTGICRLPGLNAGRTGLSQAGAEAAGFEVETVVAVTDDKAQYFPGSEHFMIKMVAEKKTEKLLGIQVLGPGAVDKMIDIAVTALSLGASLEQLSQMDFAYAPPFSTALHPFAQAVHILMNKMRGKMDSITPASYRAGDAEEYKLIDVSVKPSLKGAAYVDLTKIEGEVEGLGKDEKLLLVCKKGRRAYLAQNRLKHYGYTGTKVLEGGTLFNRLK